jgi:hypothetical protein
MHVHLIDNRSARGLVCNVLNVAILVNGLAVFVATQIGLQIYGLAAKNAGYPWDGLTTHNASFGRSQTA